MQDMILILSRLLAKRYSPRSKKVYFRFHFKGFYSGLKIKEIHVYPQQNTYLEKDNNYLLWVKYIGVRENILEVSLFKHKRIE